MKAETRQTYIGVFGLTAVEITALTEGMNGTVAMAYFVAVVLLIAPEALDNVDLPIFGGE